MSASTLKEGPPAVPVNVFLSLQCGSYRSNQTSQPCGMCSLSFVCKMLGFVSNVHVKCSCGLKPALYQNLKMYLILFMPLN